MKNNLRIFKEKSDLDDENENRADNLRDSTDQTRDQICDWDERPNRRNTKSNSTGKS